VTNYRKHPSYATGYEAGLADRPRRGRSDAYDAGYDAGVRAANLFIANGFKRDCGGFSIPLGPITATLLKGLK
jgi:hypothetical protein